MMEKIILQNDDYWLIKTKAVEWVYVVTTLMRSITAKPEDNAFSILIAEDGDWMYMLKKQLFSAETIGKAVGLSAEDVAKRKVLNLHGPDASGLPSPTVAYWGTA